MPVTFEPLENGRIMFFTVTDPWKIEELLVWYPVMEPYFERSGSKIHTLMDLIAMKTVAGGVLRGRHSASMEHPNSGYCVFVGGGSFARSIAELAFKLSRNTRFKFMNSVEEALTFLRSQIATEDSRKGRVNG
jgi:hypothetical protein